jgi:hypothetical protein
MTTALPVENRDCNEAAYRRSSESGRSGKRRRIRDSQPGVIKSDNIPIVVPLHRLPHFQFGMMLQEASGLLAGRSHGT